jgi:hypothetical protein
MSEQIEIYPDAPTPVELIAVCHTPGCPVEGQSSVNAYYPYGNSTPPVYMGQCGGCQQPITDLQPVPSPALPMAEAPAPTPIPVEPSVPTT